MLGAKAVTVDDNLGLLNEGDLSLPEEDKICLLSEGDLVLLELSRVRDGLRERLALFCSGFRPPCIFFSFASAGLDLPVISIRSKLLTSIQLRLFPVSMSTSTLL